MRVFPKWLPKSLRRTPPAPRRPAVRLESLEAREVPATVFTWTGNSSNLWGDGGNWQGGVAPTPAVTDAQLVFPAGASSIDNVANLNVDRITLNGGNTILLSGVALGLDGSAAGDQVVASGAASAIVGGNGLNLFGLASQIDVAAGSQLDFNTALTGANGVLRKVGTGTLKLTGAASYTGETQVQDGVLALADTSGTAPVGPGLLTVGDGTAPAAELRLLASNQLPATTAIKVRADGTVNLNGFDDVIGDVTLAGGVLDAAAGNLAVANLHATANSPVQAAAGGRVNLLTGQHTVEVDTGVVLTISAPIKNAGGGAVGGITKIGAGELFFNNQHAGDPNSYTGLTLVRDGTLRLTDTASNSAFQGDLQIGDTAGAAGSAAVVLGAINEIPDAVAVSINGDGELDLNGHNETVGPLTLNAGAVVTGTATLTLNGTLSTVGVAPAAATITGNLNLGAGTRTLDVTDDTAGTDLLINGVISGGNLLKTGTGTLEFQGSLNAPNTYGTTSVADGILLLNHGSPAAVPGSLFIGDGNGNPGTAVVRLAQFSEIANTAGVAVFSDGLLDLNGFSELFAGLVMVGGQVTTGVSALTITGDVTLSASPVQGSITGKLDLGGATRAFDGPGTLQIAAVVSNGGITKTGTGRLILAGNNTYTGPTTLAGGELWVQGSQPQSNVTVTGGTLNPTGTLGQLAVTGGVVSPGLSEDAQPSTNGFTLGAGTYAADMFGPNDGDRAAVTGGVNLTGGTLDLHRTFGPNLGTPPAAGQALTIISNDGADPVVGTFNGLAEGATVAANGRALRITYAGGDGNDVVLTDVTPEPYAVGAGPAGGNVVRVYNPDGTLKVDVPAFEDNVSGGVRTAVADVNHDGVADLVVGTGPGTAAEVRVFDGATGQRVRTALPFADFQGGVFVAAGDFNADGFSDIVVTPDEGGGPRVTILSGKDGAVMSNFFAIDDANFRGGARAAVGDVNGDGTPDLVVSAGFGGGPRIAVYNGASLGGTPTKLMNDFFAFEQGLRNGAYVAAGDLNGDGKADLIFGGGPGGGPRVLALDPVKLVQGDVVGATLANFFAGNTANRGGVRVAAKYLDGDARMDLIVGDGTGAGSHVTAYLGKDVGGGTPPAQASFDAFPGFLGGVFVG